MKVSNKVKRVPVSKIRPNPKQPRQTFDQEKLINLAASIKEHGVIQPLVVCPQDRHGFYTLIAGERRLRASQIAKLTTVPVIIRSVKDDDDLLVMALTENVDREDMSPVEEGDAYLKLRKGNEWSNQEIARRVGVTDTRVGHCINCASLPAVTRALIHRGELYSSAKFISILKDISEIDPDACSTLAEEVVNKSPSLKAATRSAEGVLAYLRNIQRSPRKKAKKAAILEIASERAKVDLDEDLPPSGWDLLQQSGIVPPWSLVVKAAMDVCSKCELHDIANAKMCSACTAAQMLVSLASLTELQKA